MGIRFKITGSVEEQERRGFTLSSGSCWHKGWSPEPALPLVLEAMPLPVLDPQWGPCTVVPEVLICPIQAAVMSLPPRHLQSPAKASCWQNLIGARLLREPGKCRFWSSSPQRSEHPIEGRSGTKKERFSQKYIGMYKIIYFILIFTWLLYWILIIFVVVVHLNVLIFQIYNHIFFSHSFTFSFPKFLPLPFF